MDRVDIVGGRFLRALLAIGMCLCFTSTLMARQALNIQHNRPTVVTAGETNTLEFQVPGIVPDAVQEAFLMYRYLGDSAYQRVRANLEGQTYSVGLSVDEGTSLEYYFVIDFIDGSSISFPENEPEANPIAVDIVEAQEETAGFTGKVGGIEYTILSPLPKSESVPEEALVAVTLFYKEGTVNPDSFRVFMDGLDVTADADVSPYFISYIPQGITPGRHKFEIGLRNGKKLRKIASSKFRIIDPDSRKARRVASGNTFNGQVDLMARNQRIFGEDTDIGRGRIRLNGKQGAVRYSLNGLLTSQE